MSLGVTGDISRKQRPKRASFLSNPTRPSLSFVVVLFSSKEKGSHSITSAWPLFSPEPTRHRPLWCYDCTPKMRLCACSGCGCDGYAWERLATRLDKCFRS